MHFNLSTASQQDAPRVPARPAKRTPATPTPREPRKNEAPARTPRRRKPFSL